MSLFQPVIEGDGLIKIEGCGGGVLPVSLTDVVSIEYEDGKGWHTMFCVVQADAANYRNVLGIQGSQELLDVDDFAGRFRVK